MRRPVARRLRSRCQLRPMHCELPSSGLCLALRVGPQRRPRNRPWRMAPGELFDLEGKEKLDCSRWLGQQLVMFDRRWDHAQGRNQDGGHVRGRAHSINVSRLLQAEDEKARRAFQASRAAHTGQRHGLRDEVYPYRGHRVRPLSV